MEQFNQAFSGEAGSEQALSSRLREAAIDRTQSGSEQVDDDFVLDPDGVIDLREFRKDPGRSIAAPAQALASIRGQLGDAAEISNLYDESKPSRRWRLGRRDRTVAPTPTGTTDEADEIATVTSLEDRPRLSTVDQVIDLRPADDIQLDDTDLDDTVVDTTVLELDEEVDLDLDANRPEAECPKCLAVGHRDLFDRFSQMEFYSCDRCLHMWQQEKRED